MSQCSVCGQEYGLTHSCAGIAPLITADETAPPPKLRFAPLYYLDEAFKIMTWDDVAVRRASRDNNSLLYGFLILAIGTAIPFGFLVQKSFQLGYPVPWSLMAPRYAQTLAYTLAWIILQGPLTLIFGSWGVPVHLLSIFGVIIALLFWAGTVPGGLAARRGQRSDGDLAMAVFVAYAFGQWIPKFL